MKYSFKYLFFGAVIVFLFSLRTDVSIENYETAAGRDTEYNSEVWNPIISESINEKGITLVIDGLERNINSSDIFMDEDLNIMIAGSELKKNFDCAVNLYKDKHLVLEKYCTKLEMVLESNAAYVNDSEVELRAAAYEINDEVFVPLEIVARELSYDYSWDSDNYKVYAFNNSKENKIVPFSYDLREALRNSKVKDQGRFGTCWAFASLTAIETALMPTDEIELSPDHMSLQNSFSAEQNDGGEYTMATAYLVSWQGPVFEADDPYGDGISDDTLTAVKHVQEVQIIAEKDYEGIKEAVYKYGGVQSSLYTSLTSPASKSIYYNREKNAYCYKGEERPNHDIVIIGWDDNFSKDNFNMNLEGDGAFICQNSWGESFGDDGVFYVSYYDTNIGIHNVVYSRVDDTNNYDYIYQSDLCGWVGQLGYGYENVYFANVYTAKSDEYIEAAGFYATGADTKYEIYYIDNFESTDSFDNRRLVTKGEFKNAGYYTVDFEEKIPVDAGEKFAIMVYITTPNSVHPAAIEYSADEATKNVDLTDGEGYISLRGKKWDNVEETQSCNLCLKAYTADRN